MGPSAGILLYHALTEEQLTDLEQWLRSITSRLEGQRGDWWPFWMKNGNLIDLPSVDCGDACAFGLSLHNMQSEQDFRDKDSQAAIREERAQLFQHLGSVPEQSIDIFAGCNHAHDHRILGQLALLLAERYDGTIDLNGALTPPLEPEQDWDDVTIEEVEHYIQELSLPGRIFHMYYITVRDTIWISHLVDADFLRAWLQHPRFHMIK